ncbi:undecaprenyl-phosphate glucose phosphotransferase [Flavihumibacter sp. R14]|nr:undecaprenyl-phosphate glucose phosphotransferase [Flavihumibacter soli]
MTKPYQIYSAIKYLIDAPLLFISLWLAAYYLPGEEFLIREPFGIILILYTILAWYGSAEISKLYKDFGSNKFSEEIISILFTGIIYFVFFTSFLFLFKVQYKISNHFIVLYLSVLLFLVTIFKYIIRKFLHSIIYQGKLVNRILLIGSTPAAKDFYDTINKYYYYGYKCVGFLDNQNTMMNGCTYLGKVDELAQVMQEQPVDEVIVALSNADHQQIKSSIETCDFHGKRVRLIPDLYLYTSSNIQMNNIGLLPVINLRSLPQDRFANKLLKRAFDVLFSLSFFLLLGWWLLPLIALLIKLGSKGPVFFKQERWGLNNERIICYKFRSMVNGSKDTDEDGNYMQAIPNDLRVTSFGKYLRKTNMDELPQFWNVLIGNMSVVGPRPHPTPLNLASIETVDRYMLRHLVKPGISGLAQVNGCRGETQTPEDMQKRVNFDLFYIHKWTFWLDCQIILQTIINIFRGDQNAY